MFPDAAGRYFDVASETKPLAKLKEEQLVSLKRVLRHAYSECSFYRRLFRQSGLNPEDVHTFDDFKRKVPIVTKKDLVDEMRRTGDYTAGIFPANLKGRMGNIVLTSGVTGLNTFLVTTKPFMERFATGYMSREMWMEMLRPKMTVFLQVCGWHFVALALNRVMQTFHNNVIAPWGTQMYKFSRGFVSALEESRPEYMITTPSMLLSVVNECKKQGIEPARLFDSVKYMSVAGEGITPGTRRKLTNELGLYDMFESGGSVDGVWGGGECLAHNGHHVWMDQGFIEVVDPESCEPLGSGERGAAVNTHFSLDGSIYIRFNSQDYASVSDEGCECGRTHNRIEIYDRLSNSVVVGTRRISTHELALCFEQVPEVADGLFSVVRNRMDKLALKVALTSGVKDPKRTEQRLTRAIRNILGTDSAIEWVDPNDLTLVHGKLVRIEG